MEKVINKLSVVSISLVGTVILTSIFSGVVSRGSTSGYVDPQFASFARGQLNSRSPSNPQAAPVTASQIVKAVVPEQTATGAKLNAFARVSSSTVWDNPLQFDDRRQFALGMIETANDDTEIGLAGEVSRYQIMPAVWKQYSKSRRYHDPEVSLDVARRHWASLREFFISHAKREPSDFDMYVLWNTRGGYYASRGYEPGRLHPVVRDRAQRFVNLVERKVS